MGRATILLIGIMVLSLIFIGLSDAPRQWLSPQTVIVNRIPASISTDDRPIPALTTQPKLLIPQWILYVGSVTSLLIAAVMLRKFHLSDECRWLRHPRPPGRV